MNETTKDAEDFTAEDILNDYRVKNDLIEVLLPDGRKMLFHPLPDTPSRRNLNNAVDDLIDKIPGIEDVGYKEHFLRRLPELANSDLRFSAEIHLRAVKPLVSFETACAWHQAPTVVQHVQDRLNVADKEMLALLYDRLAKDAEGKTQTPGSGAGSSPVSAPSQDEPPTP